MLQPEIVEFEEIIELLKQELILLQDKCDKDYKLLNDRIDSLCKILPQS